MVIFEYSSHTLYSGTLFIHPLKAYACPSIPPPLLQPLPHYICFSLCIKLFFRLFTV